MKKVLLIAFCSLFFLGCNMNPSKEARLQQLEMEIQQTMDKINSLEGRVQTLEDINEELETRILALEKQ
jgi:predicted  nucleic acid-binding Zn-ribbon protein